jgi:hypothetical protein
VSYVDAGAGRLSRHTQHKVSPQRKPCQGQSVRGKQELKTTNCTYYLGQTTGVKKLFIEMVSVAVIAQIESDDIEAILV